MKTTAIAIGAVLALCAPKWAMSNEEPLNFDGHGIETADALAPNFNLSLADAELNAAPAADLIASDAQTGAVDAATQAPALGVFGGAFLGAQRIAPGAVWAR